LALDESAVAPGRPVLRAVAADAVVGELCEEVGDLAGVLQVELACAQRQEEEGAGRLHDVRGTDDGAELLVVQHQAGLATQRRLKLTQQGGGGGRVAPAGLVKEMVELLAVQWR